MPVHVTSHDGHLNVFSDRNSWMHKLNVISVVTAVRLTEWAFWARQHCERLCCELGRLLGCDWGKVLQKNIDTEQRNVVTAPDLWGCVCRGREKKEEEERGKKRKGNSCVYWSVLLPINSTFYLWEGGRLCCVCLRCYSDGRSQESWRRPGLITTCLFVCMFIRWL